MPVTRGQACSILIVVAACTLEPLNVEGLMCDDRRRCPEGYVCLNGLCTGRNDAGTLDAGALDAGTPRTDGGLTLLGNPGFEILGADGGILLWRRVFTGTTLTAHRTARSGTYSASLLHDGQDFPMVLSMPVYDGPAGGLRPTHGFCGAVWARTSQANVTARVYLSPVEMDDAGSPPVQLGRVSEEVGPAWQRISSRVAVAYTGVLPSMALQVWVGTADNTKGVLIDDAELRLMTPDASCP